MGGALTAGSILGGGGGAVMVWVGEHGSPGETLMDHPGLWMIIVFHAPPSHPDEAWRPLRGT